MLRHGSQSIGPSNGILITPLEKNYERIQSTYHEPPQISSQ